MWRGQDTNWDQRNYHLAVPFLLLLGNFWSSVAPAGQQSYLNPLPLIPAYLAIRHLPPILATLSIAAVQALAFIAAGRLCQRLAGSAPETTLLTACGLCLTLASPIALSEAGTTFVDLPTAAPVLLAYLLITLRGPRPGPAVVFAGLLLGLAAGLKLTNAIYLIGLPVALLFGPETGRRRLGLIAISGAAAAIGGLCVAGWWHLTVWQHFGNPLFPFYNRLFQSPDFPLVNTLDDRYIARSVLDVWRYPWWWLVGGGPAPGRISPSGETDPHDARFMLVLIGGLVLLAVACLRAHLRRRLRQQPQIGLLAAWLVIYLAWLFLFGIHRYMAALEIMTGPALLVLILQIPRPRPRRVTALAAVFLTLIILHVPNWNRMPFAATWRTVGRFPTDLPDRSLVLLADAPTAVAALSLPDSTLIAGLTAFDLQPETDTSLARQLRQLLASPEVQNRYVVFRRNGSPEAWPLLQRYHLTRGIRCRSMMIDADDLVLCDLTPTPG